MNNLIIHGNRSTPSVDFNLNTGIIKIFGRSVHENPIKFYEPISDWIEEFLKKNPKKITFQIHVDYLNTLSLKEVLTLMKKLEAYSKLSNSTVKIIWKFDEDDEDMKDLGISISTIINLPFEHLEILDQG